MEKGRIYLIKCLENNMKYVGKTTQSLNDRKSNHLGLLRHGNHCTDIQADFDAYGEGAFYFQELEEVEIEKLPEREKHYYNLLDESERYNIKEPPDVNVFFSDEIKKNMRQAQKWDRNPNSRLTLEEMKELKRLVLEGNSKLKDIAERFEVSQGYCSNIRQGRKLKYLRIG